MNGVKFYWPYFVPIGTRRGPPLGSGEQLGCLDVDDYAGVTPALRGGLAGASSGGAPLRLNPTNVGETRAMSPCLNDNWPQGRGGPRTAPPGPSLPGRVAGPADPDYWPISNR